MAHQPRTRRPEDLEDVLQALVLAVAAHLNHNLPALAATHLRRAGALWSSLASDLPVGRCLPRDEAARRLRLADRALMEAAPHNIPPQADYLLRGGFLG